MKRTDVNGEPVGVRHQLDQALDFSRSSRHLKRVQDHLGYDDADIRTNGATAPKNVSDDDIAV